MTNASHTALSGVESSGHLSSVRVAGSTAATPLGLGAAASTAAAAAMHLHAGHHHHQHATHSHANMSVPVWRSVGEKSALRGYLAVLGVSPEASLADIRSAYKKLALLWHPDRSDAPNARMKFQEISQAYMCLKFGSLVRMADGSTRPVESIRLGDSLLGSGADDTKVAHAPRHAYAPHMYEIRYASGAHTVTPNHLVTLRWGRNPTAVLDRPAAATGPATLRLNWVDSRTMKSCNKVFSLEGSSDVSNAALGGLQRQQRSSPLLSRDLHGHATDFALWWLSGRARAGLASPLRTGDLIDVPAWRMPEMLAQPDVSEAVTVPMCGAFTPVTSRTSDAPSSSACDAATNVVCPCEEGRISHDMPLPMDATPASVAPEVDSSVSDDDDPIDDLVATFLRERRQAGDIHAGDTSPVVDAKAANLTLKTDHFREAVDCAAARHRQVCVAHGSDTITYPLLSTDTETDFVYMLNHPLSADSPLTARGHRPYALQQLERAWRLLNVKDDLAKIMLSEMNPTIAPSGGDAHDLDVCCASMQAALHTQPKVIVAFGATAHAQWRQYASLMDDVVGVSEVSTPSKVDRLLLRLNDGRSTSVLFAPQPNDGWQFDGVRSAIADAHDIKCSPEDEDDLASRNYSQLLSVQQVPGGWYSAVQVDAPDHRFVLADGAVVHNCLIVAEEGDAQEIDVGLYEREAQESCEDLSYLGGMAGVTSGLAGVFCGVGLGTGGAYSPYLGLNYKSPESLHLDLYRNGGVKQVKHPAATHALTCTCHAHAHHHPQTQSPPRTPPTQPAVQPTPQPHGANCHCHSHPHDGKCAGVEAPLSTPSLHELDIASAVAADVSLLTGVLAPPVTAVGDNSVQVRITPLAHPPSSPVVYQIQLKIKKSYQLVYQGSALTYTVPNLVPGTKYMFRVRACPAVMTRRRSVASGADRDSDDDLDLEEIAADVSDESTGLGLFSQPTTVTTQGAKPDGNAPHPPVLSNLQIAALKKKEAKGKKKAAAAAQVTKGQEDEPTVATTSALHSNVSTPSKSSRSLDAAVTAPSTPPSGAVAAPLTSPAPTAAPAAAVSTSATISKKEAKLRAKQAEDDRRRAEAAAESQRQLAEEVAYQKFLMEAREEAERVRLVEEQQELERYAKLKEEHDIRRKAEAAQEEAAQRQATGNKRGKKNAKEAAVSTTTTAATAAPSTPAGGRGKKAAPAPSPSSPSKAAAVAAAAAAPIMHIKLTPEQQAAIKLQQQHSAAAKEAGDKSSRAKGRDAKTTATVAAPQPAATIAPSTPIVSKAAPWASPMAPLPAAKSASPLVTATVGVAVANSPIIVKKQPGAKAWATPTVDTTISAPLLPLSLGATVNSAINAADSLADHLHRFDASKPWQAEMNAQHQTMHEQQSLQHSYDAARFHSLPSYTSSAHSLLSASSTPFSSSLASVDSIAAAAPWSEDDLLLSDLQQELERERWNSNPNSAASAVPSSSLLASPTSAAVEAAWNNTANTTVSSHSLLAPLSSAGLHFSPLSSLLSDYADTSAFAAPQRSSSNGTAALGHDGIFMPPANSAISTGGFFSSPPRTPPTPSQQSQAQLSSLSFSPSPDAASSLLSYSSLHSFPTTGLSRDAPSFSPMGGSAAAAIAPATITSDPDLDGALLTHHSQSGSAIGGHTRLPLPTTAAANGATPTPALAGIFNSFSLPAFSSFASFGASSAVTDADWSAAAGTLGGASVSSLAHLDDDADLFNSIPPLPTDADDVTLIPGGAAMRAAW